MVCSGCELVFPLERQVDDAASPPDGPRCASVGERITLPLTGDSFVVSGDIAPHGSEPQLSVYSLTASRVVLRFQTNALKLSQFDLTLKPRRSCGTPCEPCIGGDSGGTIAARAIRPDWDEATMTEQLRDGIAPWTQLPGPAGPDASADLVGDSIFVTPSDAFTLAIDISAVDRSQWPSADELSLLLFANDPRFEVSASFASKDDACASPGEAPLLTAVCTDESL